MRRKLVLSSAITLIVTAGALAVLCGCTAEKAESVAGPEVEASEGGETAPDVGPEGSDPGLAPPPDATVTGPAWPEPGTDNAESLPVLPRIAPQPVEGPAAPATSPGYTVGPQPAPAPWERETEPRPVPTSPNRDLAVAPDRGTPPPDFATAGDGPVLYAPANVPGGAHEPVGIRRKPGMPKPSLTEATMAEPRMAEATMAQPPVAEGPRPMAMPPQPLLAPAPAPEASGDQPMAMEPRIARPSIDVARAEPAPDEDRPGVGISPPNTEPSASSPGADAAEQGYQVVSVFYGTDRKPVDAGESQRRGYLGWLYLTAACAVISLALIVTACRLARRLPLLLLAGTGVAATLVFGAIAVLTGIPGEPVGPRPDWTYGDERGQLEMGICKVSIPQRHQVGAIERPSILRFELREDPREHVVVLELDEQPPDAFFAALRDRVESSATREAFVFVHGFNTTFDEAAYRTAQLAHDLKFEGAPIFFSWPSQGGLLEYAIDETNVVWAVPHLKQFLIDVARNSNARAVHLVAHSMGNRALTSALQLLSYELQDQPPMFRQVVLTAPDIDAEVFRRDLVPAIVTTADRVTLYASSNDEALKLSKAVHGYRRAGDSGGHLLVIPGIDTVDVSSVDTSFIGHGYFGDNERVIADMLDLINESKPPHMRRFLEPKQMGELLYWVFRGDARMIGSSQPPEAPVRR